MAVCASVVLTGWFIVVRNVYANSDITLFSLPINITSWKLGLKDAQKQSISERLGGLKDSLQGHVHEYARLAKNISFDCAAEGEECIPGVPSCCPGVRDDELDLSCLEDGDTFTCRRPSGSEEVAGRMDALQYGDSKGVLDSHPWANSWEFQSKSTMEREELHAAEDAEFERTWTPSPTDDYWVNIYKNIKKKGKDMWDELKKREMLKELKDSLVDTYKKHMARTKKPKTNHIPQSDIPVDITSEAPDSENYVEEKKSSKYIRDAVDPWIYPDGYQEKGGKQSEENLLKFSDEVPKQEKKVEFKIDDVIKEAAKFMGKKLKEIGKDKKQNKVNPYSLEDFTRLHEIDDTEDKLIAEIAELKRLQEKQKQKETEKRTNEPDIEKLIGKQVRLVLDEERRLDKLRKMEELRLKEHP